MSFSHFRAALSFKKMDNQKPVTPVSSNPQHQPPTARTSARRRSSVTGRNSVQRIGNRRASVKNSMSIRRVKRLPQLGLEPTCGARSTAPNESGDPLNAFYSGFFYDDDEVERNEPNLSTLRPSRQTVTSSRTSNRQRTSFFTRLTSRVKPPENLTTQGQLSKDDNGNTHNPHLRFHPEDSPSPNLSPSETAAASQPCHLTSIIPDPARCSRFSLHGLGTLLLPQAPQPGSKHRNRNASLISPSKQTFEHHSGCTGESDWEDLGDTDEVPNDVKTKERLAAWTNLTSDVAPNVAPGDVAAPSVLETSETRDVSQDLRVESALLALCRTESISTTSSDIDIDALPSVTSHLDAPFTPVGDQFPTSVWDEYQCSALRSSTDLIHGSLESNKALADLIDVLGLDSNTAGGKGLSREAPVERKNTSEVPLCPSRKYTLLDSQRPVTPPTERPLPPSPTTPKYATMPASHRSTQNRSNSFKKPTLFSLHKELNQSFHPILDIEVKKFSLPATQTLKSSALYPRRSRDRADPEPHGPRSNRKSFLPDMSGWIMETEERLKKVRGASTEPKLPRPYMDQLPPTLESLLPGKKGKRQTSKIFPKLLSRSAKSPPSHWPPVSPSQPVLLTQGSAAGTSPTRASSLKASRFERRANRVDGSDSSMESSIPPLPIMPPLNAYPVGSLVG